MIWLPDELSDDPRLAEAGLPGIGLLVTALCVSERNESDGFVSLAVLRRSVGDEPAVIDRLLELAVFHRTVQGGVDGVLIDVAYQKHQLTADEKARRRKQKVEAGRKGGQRSGQVRRSRGECEAGTKQVLQANRKQTRSKPEALSLSLAQDPIAPGGAPAADAAACGPQALMDAWNTLTTPPLKRCVALSTKRRKMAQARLRERPSLDEWWEVIARINASPFCRGGGQQGWIADFTWLVRPDTAISVLEGKYDDATAAKRDATAAREAKRATLPTCMGRCEGSRFKHADLCPENTRMLNRIGLVATHTDDVTRPAARQR